MVTDRSKSRKSRRRPGRPSKLTPETEARILNAIRCGAPNNVACAAAGIHEDTMYGWLERGREKPGSEYAEFSRKLERAKQEGITTRLAIVMKARLHLFLMLEMEPPSLPSVPRVSIA